MSFEQDGIKQVEKEELKELLKNQDQAPIIIDVRELDEYEEGHIPGLPLIPNVSFVIVIICSLPPFFRQFF